MYPLESLEPAFTSLNIFVGEKKSSQFPCQINLLRPLTRRRTLTGRVNRKGFFLKRYELAQV